MNKGVILGVDSEHVVRAAAGYVHHRIVTTVIQIQSSAAID
jgi:hypothetical protein